MLIAVAGKGARRCGSAARHDVGSCCCDWATWPSRTRSRCCGCCQWVTGIRHGDPRSSASDRGPGTSTRPAASAFHSGRPGVAGRAAAPAANDESSWTVEGPGSVRQPSCHNVGNVPSFQGRATVGAVEADTPSVIRPYARPAQDQDEKGSLQPATLGDSISARTVATCASPAPVSVAARAPASAALTRGSRRGLSGCQLAAGRRCSRCSCH